MERNAPSTPGGSAPSPGSAPSTEVGVRSGSEPLPPVAHKEEEEEEEEEDSDDDEEDTKTYCFCNSLDDGRFMICCDSCDDWYHPKCVGKTKKEAQQIDVYICPNCEEMGDELFDDTKEEEPGPPLKNDSKHTCSECNPAVTFSSAYSLKRHLTKKHGINAPSDPPPPKRKREDGVGKSSNTKSKVVYREDEPESDDARPDEEDDKMFDPTEEGYSAVAGDDSLKKKRKTQKKSKSSGTVGVCLLSKCFKHARDGNDFCSDDHEAKHAQSAFLAMLGGGAGGAGGGNEGRGAVATSAAASVGAPTDSQPKPIKKKQMVVSLRDAKDHLSRPGQSSGSGSGKSKNKFREGVLIKMAQAVKKCSPKLEQAVIDAEVEKIEKAMFKLFNKQTGTPYKRKYKTLLFNLSDNKELVENIFSGELSAYDLVRKTAADLVNSQMKKKLEAKKAESFDQYVVESTAIQIVVTNEKDLDRRIDPISSSHRPSPSPEREIREAKPVRVSGGVGSGRRLSVDTSTNKLTEGRSVLKSGASLDSPPMSPLLMAAAFGGDGGASDDIISTTPPDSPPGIAPESPSYEVLPAQVPARVITASSSSSGDSETATKSQTASKWGKPTHVWEGEVKNSSTVVPVKAKHVLGNSPEELLAFLPKKLQCQGRIKPEQVWDYVDKLELSSSKQVVAAKLDFANEDAEVDFISLFTYFNSRQRCGVLGGSGNHGMKDMYLVPIAAEDDLPKSLGPGTYLKGPGIPAARESDILVAIFVANATNKKRVSSKRKHESQSSSSSVVPGLSKRAPDYLSAYGKLPKRERKKTSDSDVDLDRPYSPSQDDDLLDRPYSPSQDDDLLDRPYSPSQDDVGAGARPGAEPGRESVGGGGGYAGGGASAQATANKVHNILESLKSKPTEAGGTTGPPPVLPPAPMQGYSAPTQSGYGNRSGYGSSLGGGGGSGGSRGGSGGIAGGSYQYQDYQSQQQQQQRQQQQPQRHDPRSRSDGGSGGYSQHEQRDLSYTDSRDPYGGHSRTGQRADPRQQQQQHQQQYGYRR